MPSLDNYLNDLQGLIDLHQRDLLAYSIEDVENFRLKLLRKRFDTLRPQVSALAKLASLQGVSDIQAMDDAAPILFQHTVYKSYPLQYLEKGNFVALNRWLNQLTAHDISSVDVSDCDFVHEWLDRLEDQTPLTVIHTTGTSGKLSFIPRTAPDSRLQFRAGLAKWQGVGDEPDLTIDLDNTNLAIPTIQPNYRWGYYMGHRLTQAQVDAIGDENQREALFNEMLDPDILSLAGRVATAEAKGALDDLYIAPQLLERFRINQERQKNRSEINREFFERALDRFAGQRVYLASTAPNLYAWAEEGKRRGLSGIFASDSFISSGGGMKGFTLPPDWREQIAEIVGTRVVLSYGMSELCPHCSECSHGNYHFPPHLIPWVLDEHTGEPLPRRGEQTGRGAFFDLLVDSYWGGFVTGDEVTINWNGDCGCGRKSEFLYPDIRRFSEKTGQEDKISCAGAPDAHDKAMAFLLERAAR